MGCGNSSSASNSTKLINKNEGRISLKNTIFIEQRKKHNHEKFTKACSSLNLEQIFDGRGKNLLKRFEFDSACLLFDISLTHILLLNGKQLYFINLNTMNIDKTIVLIDTMNIQEIVWSSKLKYFLILTTDQLYKTNFDQFELISIHQIQFINEGHRKSYMTVNGDDLLINHSFGHDLRRYCLSNLNLLQSSRVYEEYKDICITTIQLNSKKILALAISIGEKQMIDLINLNTDKIIHRIKLDLNENILYPINLHFQGLWFAKTCVPYVNIGHCLIASDGQIARLKLFSNQDNFIRSLRMTDDQRWLLIGRQHALEIYSL
ncbi:unnamed protein product [Rotaria socialis]|uniref:Uncharacterized protein n=1 Tax=Rotaria socialis TaxID=392032 RepID=A0A817YN28_9BILA|nr:unnamed protein product [Rotaria socialis]CAF3341145.1 unnamed protein product [Rotaria socialis]CAF3382407.1 unnamed protein product [Rotaria socialis]CAF3464900.1 unnamed protein product [Rotaria socialis]CAF4241408.1 unnamed protein product [Rotaria socialis]